MSPKVQAYRDHVTKTQMKMRTKDVIQQNGSWHWEQRAQIQNAELKMCTRTLQQNYGAQQQAQWFQICTAAAVEL